MTMRFVSELGERDMAFIETSISHYGDEELIDRAAPATYGRVRALLHTLHSLQVEVAELAGSRLWHAGEYLDQQMSRGVVAHGRETIKLAVERVKLDITIYREALAHAEARAQRTGT